MPSFVIRFAETEADRRDIYRFRYEHYVTTQGLFQDEADHERRWLTAPEDEAARLLMAEFQGNLLGTARLSWGGDAPFSEALRSAYSIDSFTGLLQDRDILVGSSWLVDPEFRTGLLVFQMMWFCFEFAAANDVEVYLGQCDPHLIGAYHELGFRPFGELLNQQHDGMQVPIVMLTGDYAYHERLESALLPALKNRRETPRHLDALRGIVSENVPVLGAFEDGAETFWAELKTLLDDPEHGLCGGLFGREEALVLLAKSQLMRCPAEMAVIRKGEDSQTVYILIDGALRVVDDGRDVVTVTRRGALIGEVAFFTDRARMSDVVAGPEGATLLALNQGTLQRLIKGYGTQAAKFLLYVTRELSTKLVERAEQP